MGKYYIHGQDTSTAGTTILGLNQPASALKRLKVGYCQVGSDASADSAYEAVLQRITTTGTSTAVTPQLRDPADGAASAVAGQAHSAEPTYTASAIMLGIAGHQRSTFQWYAAPGSEIVIPKTNDAGLGLQVITSASAFNMVAGMEFEE